MLRCETTLRRKCFPVKMLNISRTIFNNTSGGGKKNFHVQKKLKIKAKKSLKRIVKHSIFFNINK